MVVSGRSAPSLPLSRSVPHVCMTPVQRTTWKIRKELNKTSETLKHVTRRAPKRRIEIESEPLPAPKPRCLPSTAESPSGPVDSEIVTVNSTELPDQGASKADTGLPVEHADRTLASARHDAAQLREDPTSSSEFSNGQRHATRGGDDSTSGEPRARERAGALETGGSSRPSTSAASPANALASPRQTNLIEATSSPATEEGSTRHVLLSPDAKDLSSKPLPQQPAACRRGEVADGNSSSVDDSAPSTSSAGLTGAVAPAEGSSTHPGDTCLGIQEEGSEPPSSASAKSVGLSHAAGDSQAVDSRAPSTDSGGSVSVPERAGALPEPKLDAASKASTQSKRSGKRGLGKRSSSSRPPATVYQLEYAWRSAAGTEARVDLLRSIPPPSISKLFRRTPLDVELLESILEHLGPAFLPEQPRTAMTWLRNLSKASRFSMTVSLMGEGEGRRAVRELLTKLSADNVEGVEDMRRQYSC